MDIHERDLADLAARIFAHAATSGHPEHVALAHSVDLAFDLLTMAAAKMDRPNEPAPIPQPKKALGRSTTPVQTFGGGGADESQTANPSAGRPTVPRNT